MLPLSSPSLAYLRTYVPLTQLDANNANNVFPFAEYIFPTDKYALTTATFGTTEFKLDAAAFETGTRKNDRAKMQAMRRILFPPNIDVHLLTVSNSLSLSCLLLACRALLFSTAPPLPSPRHYLPQTTHALSPDPEPFTLTLPPNPNPNPNARVPGVKRR